MAALMSPPLMPGFRLAWAVRKAAMVMSLAACISASSAADLIIRCARTTALALTMRVPGSCCGEAIAEEEAVGVLEGDGAAGDPPFAQEVGDQLQRFVIFLPGADFGGDLELFGDAGLFEEGGDNDRRAFGGDDDAGQPLAPPPLDAGVIIEAGAGFDQHGAEVVGAQELLGAGEPAGAFGGGDGRGQGARVTCSATAAARRLAGSVSPAPSAVAPVRNERR